MRAGTPLSFILTALLLRVPSVYCKNIWHVSIFEGPAPPPGKGPPIQASALRDKSFLPAQIAAIVAAYVFSVVVIGSSLLFVGRRLRRAAQASPRSLSMEMMKPLQTNVPITSKVFDQTATPSSAGDMKRFWPSPSKGSKIGEGGGSIRKGHKRQPSESQASVITFDESVIEDDKEKNEREMERLYAAVLEDEEERSRSNSKINLPMQQQRQEPSQQQQQQQPIRLPELQHLQGVAQPMGPPRAGTRTPQRTLSKSPRTSTKPPPIAIHSHNSSRSSLASVKKYGVRGLPISPPMGSPGLAPDYDDGYGESEPLSPRHYVDPGPAPPTPDDYHFDRQRQTPSESDRLSPRNARFPMTSIRKGSSIPQSPTVQTIHEVDSRPQLLSRDSQRSFSSRNPRAQASNQSGPLPLRQDYQSQHNIDRAMLSPGIKNTVLESRPAGKQQSLRTPGTGVPMTPYSPYMPRTPLTPMTPSRLVSRGERKRKEKEEGRRVPTIEDAVEEEADMWGSAYP